MVDQITDTAMAHHAGFAFATVYAIQYLKNSKWFPWMAAHTDTINRVVAVGTALVTSAGIKFSTESAAAGTGWTITIQVPAMLMVLYGIAVHFAAQFGLQEMFYRTAIKHVAAKRQVRRPALRAAA